MARKYTRTIDKLPRQLQTEILARKMSPQALRELGDLYAEARKRQVNVAEPSASEIRLASLARSDGYGGAASKAGVDVAKVYSAVSRVSRFHFFTGK